MADGDYQLSVSVIGAKELSDALKSVDEFAKNAIKDAINKTAIDLESEVRKEMPHLSGGLQNNLHREPAQVTATNIEAKVGTNIIYGRAQELGFPAGYTFPNYKSASFQKFAREKLGDAKLAFVVARSIFKKGMKGHFFYKNSLEKIKPEHTKNLQAALKKIVDHLATK